MSESERKFADASRAIYPLRVTHVAVHLTGHSQWGYAGAYACEVAKIPPAAFGKREEHMQFVAAFAYLPKAKALEFAREIIKACGDTVLATEDSES